LLLFITPSKEALTELNPLLHQNLKQQFIPPWMFEEELPMSVDTPPWVLIVGWVINTFKLFEQH
jgi:hypothetical protein